MPLDIEPIQVQSKFPLEKKPSLDPQQKEVYSDVFSLQNAFKILFLVLDNTFTKIADYINSGAAGVPEAPIDGIIYGRKDADWEPITGGTDVAPEVIQSASYVGNGPPTFTLPAAPTAGNIFLILCTRYDEAGVVLSGTWSYILNPTGAAVDNIKAITRPVVGGDTATIASVWTVGTPRGCSCVLLELSADAYLAGATVIPYVQASRSSLDQLLTPAYNTSLFLTMFATTGSNTLSSTPANATLVASGTGTSTQGSPRAIKVAGSEVVGLGRGVANVSATWAGGPLTTYGIGISIPSTLNSPAVTGI